MMAVMPSVELDLLFGFALGGLCVLVFLDHLDPQVKEIYAVVIPEAITQALTELQSAQDVATAKAQAAHEKEVAAVQARDAAEGAKVDGRQANDQLDQKRAAFVALVASTYNAPTLPPPATQPLPPA